MATTSEHEDQGAVFRLKLVRDDLKTLLQASKCLDGSLEKTDKRMHLVRQSLSATSKRVAPIQTLSMANKALDTRINRAGTPALSLLETFRGFEALQGEIMLLTAQISRQIPNHEPGSAIPATYEDRLGVLVKYVDCVNRMKDAIDSIIKEGEPTILKLQEAVEFLSRTKATDQFRAHRLRETLVTLKALYETEIDKMRFDGLLDEALMQLQDEFEGMLHRLKHRNIRAVIERGSEAVSKDLNEDRNRMAIVKTKTVKEKHRGLGSAEETEVLQRISETLAANDCLDICIDIFVKVRYRRAAKALMRLNPEYLRTYTTEEIDEMEWEMLEAAITLWIRHFELALRTVFVSEKKLSNRVMGRLMDGLVWMECFVKVADKIMAVFFRFGEGVARGTKERPEKLFKLLDMFDALERIKPEFSLVFEGDSGRDICARFRELEKLLVHACSKVLWEFGLQIEGDSDGLPPPPDGSVPKLVRYAINYLKYLAADNYCTPMTRVLRTEQTWKTGITSKPEVEDDLLREAISNMMEALQRNVDSKRLRYKDKALSNVFAMNTYWYIYMRTRNTELGKLLGDKYMKKRYKVAAEEAAYLYQKQTWGPVVKILDHASRESSVERAEGFVEAFKEMLEKHKTTYVIQDEDLREQMKEATVKVVVPVVAEFVKSNGAVLPWSHGDWGGASAEKMIREVFDACGKVHRNNKD